MEPFKNFAGIAAALPRSNVDTDAIIPSAWLRSPRADLVRGLFAGWRFYDNGEEIPDFVLNRQPFRSASILICGNNFGCGSSREAAIWALMRFGIRCVAAPSFADIFYENAFRNGLLAAMVDPADNAMLIESIESRWASPVLEVDLNACALVTPDGAQIAINVPEARRLALFRGQDPIAISLMREAEISEFERRNRAAFPQLYRSIEGQGQR